MRALADLSILQVFIVGAIFSILFQIKRFLKSKQKNSNALIDAITSGDFDQAKLLVTTKCELINTVGLNGFYPIHAAVLAKAPLEIIKLLLENGADLTIKTKNGATAMELAKRKNWNEAIEILNA